jgi:sulfonate transport system substrate-binding protein
VELVPIDDQVISSEQEMADTFAANDLLPGEFDVAPFFSDEFNEYTTGEGGK